MRSLEHRCLRCVLLLKRQSFTCDYSLCKPHGNPRRRIPDRPTATAPEPPPPPVRRVSSDDDSGRDAVRRPVMIRAMARRLNFSRQAGDFSCEEVHPTRDVPLPYRAAAERSRPMHRDSTEARDLFEKRFPPSLRRLLCPSNVSASSSWTPFPIWLNISVIRNPADAAYQWLQ
jgi:hypothetical protein